jgi:hypothetical protein
MPHSRRPRLEGVSGCSPLKEGPDFVLLRHFEYGLMGPDQSMGDRGGMAVPPGVYVPPGFYLMEYLAQPSPADYNGGAFSPVVINEFLLRETGGFSPFIELVNRSDQPVDISDWALTEDRADPLRYLFPAGTEIGGHQYLVVPLASSGLSPDPEGGVLLLTSPDGPYGRDFVAYPVQSTSFSTGRWSYVHYWYGQTPSPGLANTVTAVPDDSVTPGPVLEVLGAVPNPFNPLTEIRFSLTRDAAVAVQIFDLAGRLVRSFPARACGPGKHGTVWNGEDNAGRALPSGTYLALVVARDSRATLKLMLAK